MKLLVTSLALMLLGGIFLLVENIYYGKVNAEGVLEESLFLPLGSIALLLGGLGLFVNVLFRFRK